MTPPPTTASQPADTSSTAGARAHARAQGGTVVEDMATVPARAAGQLIDGVDPSDLVWVETVPGGSYSARALARGTRLRLTDIRGDACAHIVVYNAALACERLCVADTVKVGWNAYLGAGQLLLSDQGRVLCSIVEDTSERHDTMAGPSTRLRNEARYGSGSPEGPAPAGRELLLLAAAKHGLSPRDVPPSISLFKGVRVEPSGELTFVGSAGPGCHVDLLAEMDVVVLIANSAHPLDPRPDYRCSPLSIAAWRSSATGPGDVLFSKSPEGERAFLNTADYLTARGIQ